MKPDNANLTRSADFDLVLQRLDGDVELLREIATVFFTEYPEQLRDLFDAVAASDLERIRRAAHKIKGTAWSFAADPATKAALELEEMKQFSDGRNPSEMAEHLSHELHCLHLALEEFLTRA